MEPRSGLLRRQGSRGRIQLAPYILLAPAAAAFLLVLVIPTGYALWISVRGFRVTPGQAYGRATMQFVGWDNFQRALADPALLDGLLRLLVFGAISVPSTMLLALVFAFIFAPAAIVLGHIAKRQIRQTGEQGEGLATAGLWLGYIFTGLYVAFCALWIILAVAGIWGSNTY